MTLNHKQNQIHIDPIVSLSQFLPESQPLIQDYKCPLCTGIYLNPIIDECGHIFCNNCFNLYYTTYQECPISNQKLNSKPTQVLILNQILQKQSLYCSNLTNGCQWSGIFKDLENHLNNECQKQKIKCKNEGCNEIFIRDEYDDHKSKCPYRTEKCLYCSELIQVVSIEKHYSECPKFKVKCPQNCGVEIEREAIDKHIKDECDNSLLECEFKKYGCNDKGFMRKEMNVRMERDMGKHMEIILKIVEKMNERINALEKGNENRGNIQNNIGRNLNGSTGNYSNTSSGSKEKDRDINNINNIIPKKLIIPVPQFKNAISKEKYKDKDNIISNEVEMKKNNNILFTKHKRAPDNEIEFIKSHRPKNEEDEVIMLDSNDSQDSNLKKNTSDVYDMDNLYQGIEINGRIAKCISTSKSEHIYVFFSHDIDTYNKNVITTWTIQFMSPSLWLGVGLCDKEKVLQNKGKFIRPKKLSIQHGSFLLSINGYSWNANVPKENNAYIPLPDIMGGDSITMTYNSDKQQLTFNIKDEKEITLNKVKPVTDGNAKLTPCILLLHYGDSVQFIEMSVLGF